jgi:hypothetical protein
MHPADDPLALPEPPPGEFNGMDPAWQQWMRRWMRAQQPPDIEPFDFSNYGWIPEPTGDEHPVETVRAGLAAAGCIAEAFRVEAAETSGAKSTRAAFSAYRIEGRARQQARSALSRSHHTVRRHGPRRPGAGRTRCNSPSGDDASGEPEGEPARNDADVADAGGWR